MSIRLSVAHYAEWGQLIFRKMRIKKIIYCITLRKMVRIQFVAKGIEWMETMTYDVIWYVPRRVLLFTCTMDEARQILQRVDSSLPELD